MFLQWCKYNRDGADWMEWRLSRKQSRRNYGHGSLELIIDVCGYRISPNPKWAISTFKTSHWRKHNKLISAFNTVQNRFIKIDWKLFEGFKINILHSLLLRVMTLTQSKYKPCQDKNAVKPLLCNFKLFFRDLFCKVKDKIPTYRVLICIDPEVLKVLMVWYWGK